MDRANLFTDHRIQVFQHVPSISISEQFESILLTILPRISIIPPLLEECVYERRTTTGCSATIVSSWSTWPTISSKNWTWNPSRNHYGGRVRTRRRTSSRSRWEEEGKTGTCRTGRSSMCWGTGVNVMGKAHKGSKRHCAKGWVAGGATLIYTARKAFL